MRGKDPERAGEYIGSYLGQSNGHVRMLGLGLGFRLRETGWKAGWWLGRKWWQG